MDKVEQSVYDSSMLIACKLIDGEEVPVNNIAASNIILKAEIFRKLCDISKYLNEGVKFDTTSPSNVYGEGLVDGIQNAIERGQRGINTNG